MFEVKVFGGNVEAALQALKRKTGAHLKEVAQRVKFAKPSERRKLKESIARRRREKVERRWKKT